MTIANSPEGRARMEREREEQAEQDRLRRQVRYTPGRTAEELHGRLFPHAPKIGIESTRRRLHELADAGHLTQILDRWYGPQDAGLRALIEKGRELGWAPLLERVRDAGPEGIARSAISPNRTTRDQFLSELLIDRADDGPAKSRGARWNLSRRGAQLLDLLLLAGPRPTVQPEPEPALVEPAPVPAIEAAPEPPLAPAPDPEPAPVVEVPEEYAADDDRVVDLVERRAKAANIVDEDEAPPDLEDSVADVRARLADALERAERRHDVAVRVAREADELAASLQRAIEALDALDVSSIPQVLR